MSTTVNQYSVMKDSGVAWIGQVPEHWKVLPNRALFDEIKERDFPEEEMLSVTIGKGVIRQATLLEDGSKKDSSNLDRSKYKLVHLGDIAYNKMRAWQGAIGVSDFRGIISPAYVVQRPKRCAVPRYFHQLFRTPNFSKEAERWSYGITSDMWSLRPEHFKLIYSCLPTVDEQAAIVRYLESFERRVRRLVQPKRKLIALLTEKKQAIIHYAVTHGLDPQAPMKESGVESLGEVPSHWEVRPLKFLVPQVTVGIVIQPAQLYVPTGVPSLRSLNISSGTIRNEQLVYISAESNATHRKSQIFAGDIVVVRTGNAGVAAIVTSEFDGANCIDLLIVRASERLVSEYLLTYLNSWSARTEVQLRSVGAIQAHYNTTTLANLTIPTPPKEEQIDILRALSKELGPLDKLIGETNHEIDLLNEYRTRLIANVVTGKLDVREAAAQPESYPLGIDDEDNDSLGFESEIDLMEFDAFTEEVEE